MSNPINLSSFCYDFISQNHAIINDLKQYDIDYSQNIQAIRDFVESQQCCKKYFQFIERMLNTTKYVSCDEFIRILSSNIIEIVNLAQTNELILIITNESILKSNIFYSLYTLNKLLEKDVKINHIYEKLEDIIEEQENIFNLKSSLCIRKNAIIIFCDDISYSGSQLAEHINDINMYYTLDQKDKHSGYGYAVEYSDKGYDKQLELNPNIQIFLNLIGILPTAHNLIKSQFKNTTQLIIPIATICFSGIVTLDQLIQDEASKQQLTINQFLKLNDCYTLNRIKKSIILESQFTTHLRFNRPSTTELSLVYPFNKYPDGISTYSRLCFIKYFDNLLTLNVDMFINTFSIYSTTFSNENNIDLKQLMEKFKIEDAESLVNDIISKYEDSEKIKDIKWIDSCGISTNVNNFINTNGNWFKSLNVFNDDKDYITNFQGDCHIGKSVIKSFYHFLSYKMSSFTINNRDSILQIKQKNDKFTKNTKYLLNNSYKKKYLKYKNKYLQLKKFSMKN